MQYYKKTRSVRTYAQHKNEIAGSPAAALEDAGVAIAPAMNVVYPASARRKLNTPGAQTLTGPGSTIYLQKNPKRAKRVSRNANPGIKLVNDVRTKEQSMKLTKTIIKQLIQEELANLNRTPREAEAWCVSIIDKASGELYRIQPIKGTDAGQKISKHEAIRRTKNSVENPTAYEFKAKLATKKGNSWGCPKKW